MIKREDWEWFGNPGHYILAERCGYRLCTLVGRYVISTVGELVYNKEIDLKWSVIGSTEGIYYETMVFKCLSVCKDKICNCGHPDISGREVESQHYATRKEAKEGHEKLCRKWAAKQ